jgi:RimJ/RimL family protein N-acetyltransferase
MNHWIPQNTSLPGSVVDLIPLNQTHFAALQGLARNKQIWEFYAFDGSVTEKFQQVLNQAITLREKREQYPFVIYHKEHQKIIGSTRFMEIQPNHRKLEIGSTWLHPDYWGTEINFECKLLLFTYAFEELEAYRVQLKTDENNVRSRKAIEKVGGKFEGILRHDMVRDNGTKRNSAYYSVTDDEWTEVKPMLTQLFESKRR